MGLKICDPGNYLFSAYKNYKNGVNWMVTKLHGLFVEPVIMKLFLSIDSIAMPTVESVQSFIKGNSHIKFSAIPSNTCWDIDNTEVLEKAA